MNTVTFGDYVRYFFFGYKLDGMDANVLAILRTIQFVALVFLGKLATSAIDALTNGTFSFEWANFREYLLPAVLAVLVLINEEIRKRVNPSVSLKVLQRPRAGTVTARREDTPR